MSASSISMTPGIDDDIPIPLTPGLTTADRVFRGVLASGGVIVLALFGAIVAFLVVKGLPGLSKFGIDILTSDRWAPPESYGLLGALVGSVVIALLALALALPLSLACALMINEYAPGWLRSILIVLVDLLATVPSIVYGFWGLEHLEGLCKRAHRVLGDPWRIHPPVPVARGWDLWLLDLPVRAHRGRHDHSHRDVDQQRGHGPRPPGCLRGLTRPRRDTVGDGHRGHPSRSPVTASSVHRCSGWPVPWARRWRCSSSCRPPTS